MLENPPTPPRLVPDRPFPPYAYLPGRNPHPTRDAGGHSYGRPPDQPDAPDPARWRACDDYLYGIDLFNHGYYWEAHEAWEGLWHACGRQGAIGTYLQALINFAAAGLKARWGNARGIRGNAETAARLFTATAMQLGTPGERYMGLEVETLLRWTTDLAARPSDTGGGAVDFDFILRPE